MINIESITNGNKSIVKTNLSKMEINQFIDEMTTLIENNIVSSTKEYINKTDLAAEHGVSIIDQISANILKKEMGGNMIRKYEKSMKNSDKEALSLGDFVTVIDNDGNERIGKILQVASENVMVDINKEPFIVDYSRIKEIL